MWLKTVLVLGKVENNLIEVFIVFLFQNSFCFFGLKKFLKSSIVST